MTNFVNFVAYDSTLFLHVPIYLKPKEQPILDLFRTESYAIPYDPADLVSNEYGEWIGRYTKIEFEKKMYGNWRRNLFVIQLKRFR